MVKETEGTFMKKRHAVGILFAAVVLVSSVIVLVLLNDRPGNPAPLRYTYSIVKEYPHDPKAFTEGLVVENGVLYESTGLWGESTLRRVELNGTVLKLYALPDYSIFGEGITIFKDKIVQLTWQSNIGFVYNIDTFEVLREFNYPGEGWGITYDGSRLIMSNGTAILTFLNPETFEKTGHVEVHDGNITVTFINELEYVHGEIYANILKEDRIAIINPQTGQVKGWIDLTGIPGTNDPDPENVLNGIAYDAKEDRLFVTGKRWSQLFEISLRAQQ
jgi:glutamine cyclotransferase